MFPKAIPGNLQSNLELLGKKIFLAQFYLAGGTAVALQLGHRISYDLDFFTDKNFDEKVIVAELEKLARMEIDTLKKGTILGRLNGVKISLFFYRYQLISPAIFWQGVNIAGVEDLSCMKLDAIQSRGTKRDFIDFWAILHSGLDLKQIFELFEKKYFGVKYSKSHLLRSLTYFEDAEKDDMPEMLKPTNLNIYLASGADWSRRNVMKAGGIGGKMKTVDNLICIIFNNLV